ncbi:MAG: family 1 encapsulin nanocompartment shell protein, partial [Actinocrinis sp.]
MNNLHRELAPVSDAAWRDLEEEVRRTFKRHVAARRVVDVPEPGGVELSAVSTGRVDVVEAPEDGMAALVRRSQPVVELRVPFTLRRQEIDDVERGALDADWQPAKEAAWKMASAEDRTIFEGYEAAAIDGVGPASSHVAVPLPVEVRMYPDAVSQALGKLRLAGVEGPYTLVLGADV